jgi:hypothetical protein
MFDWLAKHRDVLAIKMKRHRADPQVWPKYLWAARYHNFFRESIPGGLPKQLTFFLLHSSQSDCRMLSPKDMGLPS